MLKKLIVAAALVAPSMAFASPFDGLSLVINVGGTPAVSQPVYRDYGYRDHTYRNRFENQRMRNEIDREQQHQRERIIRGSRSGELTRFEVKQLTDEQADIRRLENRFLADGYLSQREFDRLKDELRQSSRHLVAQSNDRQDRDDYERHSRR